MGGKEDVELAKETKRFDSNVWKRGSKMRKGVQIMA